MGVPRYRMINMSWDSIAAGGYTVIRKFVLAKFRNLTKRVYEISTYPLADTVVSGSI
jgi:hypothetical protein